MPLGCARQRGVEQSGICRSSNERRSGVGWLRAIRYAFAVVVGWHGAEKLDWRLEGPYLDDGFSRWQADHDPLLSAIDDA